MKLLLLFLFLSSTPALADKAYDRVMQNNEIRCGYALWPSYLEIEPNTGQKSGIWYEYMEALGEITGLEIKWTTELGFGEVIAALHSGKIDVFCSGFWADINKAKGMDFVMPISYQAVVAVVRNEDSRFDNDLSKANNEDITVSGIDGEMASLIKETDFPKAKPYEVSQ